MLSHLCQRKGWEKSVRVNVKNGLTCITGGQTERGYKLEVILIKKTVKTSRYPHVDLHDNSLHSLQSDGIWNLISWRAQAGLLLHWKMKKSFKHLIQRWCRAFKRILLLYLWIDAKVLSFFWTYYYYYIL